MIGIEAGFKPTPFADPLNHYRIWIEMADAGKPGEGPLRRAGFGRQSMAIKPRPSQLPFLSVDAEK